MYVIARTLKDQGVDDVADLCRQIEEWKLFVLFRLRLQHKDMKAGVWTSDHQDRFQ
jgi:hypothetical protein